MISCGVVVSRLVQNPSVQPIGTIRPRRWLCMVYMTLAHMDGNEFVQSGTKQVMTEIHTLLDDSVLNGSANEPNVDCK